MGGHSALRVWARGARRVALDLQSARAWLAFYHDCWQFCRTGVCGARSVARLQHFLFSPQQWGSAHPTRLPHLPPQGTPRLPPQSKPRPPQARTTRARGLLQRAPPKRRPRCATSRQTLVPKAFLMMLRWSSRPSTVPRLRPRRRRIASPTSPKRRLVPQSGVQGSGRKCS